MKTGRVQIIVDGQTWFDQKCQSRMLEVKGSGSGDRDTAVQFTATMIGLPE